MSGIGMIKNDCLKSGAKYLAESLSYSFILLFVRILSNLPFKVMYVLSDLLFFPFYYIVRYRRKIVRKNLIESFPQKSKDEILRIEKRFYHFFIDLAFESCKLLTISQDEVQKRITFSNTELANNLLAEGKSVSAFIGHYGNWEWISSIRLWICNEAIVAQIYHKLRNKAMNSVMKKLRERMGNISVEMYKTVRFMANVQSEEHPYIIGFIADQSPKKREVKYYTHFLNHEVPVLVGTEKATKHFGYAALFISMKRVKRGYYACEFKSLHNDPQSLPDFVLTELYFQQLEKEIMQQPEFYLWSHNRFKHAIGTN